MGGIFGRIANGLDAFAVNYLALDGNSSAQAELDRRRALANQAVQQRASSVEVPGPCFPIMAGGLGVSDLTGSSQHGFDPRLSYAAPKPWWRQ